MIDADILFILTFRDEFTTPFINLLAVCDYFLTFACTIHFHNDGQALTDR